MTIYAQVPELSATFVIIGPDSTRAVLNDTTDPDYVGTFGEDGITGLDSPEIRENAWDLVEADGGVHGNFYFGRRPVTLTVDVLATNAQQRGAALEKLKRATNAMRGDGTLRWTTPYGGGPNQQLSFRRQQPLRITGAWKKSCFLALVAADPRIYSYDLYTTTVPVATPTTLVNQGDFNSPPSLKINGPGTDPVVKNGTLQIAFSGLTLTAGQYVVINSIQHTVVDQDGANKFSKVDFLNTQWWALGPGNNSVRIDWGSGSTGASTVEVTWRDAWV